MPKRFDKSQFVVHKLTPEDLKQRLREFELKYGMSSREFYTKLNKCELPENLDFFDWATYYEVAVRKGLIETKLKV